MSQPVRGRIHSVETFGAVDGPGIRYVVFLQGCRLRCLYCHNPDSWALEGGRETDSAAVVEEILPYRNYLRHGGVTLSGGEPLLQPDFAADILERCHQAGLHTALDTAGSVPLALSRPVIDRSDLLLLDLKTTGEAEYTELTGHTLSPTLATLDYCRETGKPIWIRHVLVPGITLQPQRLEALARLLRQYPNLQRVELLAFHKMGEYKWKELSLDYRLFQTPAPTSEEMKTACSILRAHGLPAFL